MRLASFLDRIGFCHGGAQVELALVGDGAPDALARGVAAAGVLHGADVAVHKVLRP